MVLKILVCGSRDWTNEAVIAREFAKLPKGTIIVHGAHWEGADQLADKLAMKYGFQLRRYPADWNDPNLLNKKAAGPIRNARMIREEHPDKNGEPITRCLAFTQDMARSRGTKDCTERARKAGIKVEVFSL
jgi:hypothetical protein